MIFLHGHGVGTSRAVRIFKTYGADAVRLALRSKVLVITGGPGVARRRWSTRS